MTDRIFIAVPIKDRKPIVMECLPTIAASKSPEDFLMVYDDGSRPTFWRELEGMYNGASGRDGRESLGIERQRRNHFKEYWMLREEYNFLYLTDSDALHDPSWREVALDLHRRTGGAPVCLYNTAVHANMAGNTKLDNPGDPIIWRRVAPGISYLLSREHVRQVMACIDWLDHWDWMVPQILGHRMVITRTSYVDHIGLGGLHHPPAAGLDEGDVALNPTPWLVAKRAEVVGRLKAVYGNEQTQDQRPSDQRQASASQPVVDF